MIITRLVLAGLTVLSSVCVTRAQVLLDDFSSPGKWSATNTIPWLGAAQFNIAGGVANYIVPVAAENSLGYISFLPAVGSYGSDWNVQVDVGFASPSTIFTPNVEQFLNAQLMVTKTGDVLDITQSGAPSTASFSSGAGLFEIAGNAYTRSWVAGAANPLGATPDDQLVEGAEKGFSYVPTGYISTLRISFNSSTKVLTASYDPDGAANGYNFLPLDFSVDVGSPANGWTMGANDTFTFSLWGNSAFDAETGSGLGPQIASNRVTFDNFRGTNLISVGAVPEPSTYGLMGATLLVAVTALRRRRSSR